jgi:hypothetical protein
MFVRSALNASAIASRDRVREMYASSASERRIVALGDPESKDHPYYQCSRFFNSKNGARINGREVEMLFTSTANHTAPDDLGGTYSRGRVSRMASGWYGSRL